MKAVLSSRALSKMPFSVHVEGVHGGPVLARMLKFCSAASLQRSSLEGAVLQHKCFPELAG